MRASSPIDTEPASAAGNPSYPEPPRLDVERYRAHLKGLDLTEEQAAEVLKTLWTIVEAFVDEAFGVDSFSLARPQAEALRRPKVGKRTVRLDEVHAASPVDGRGPARRRQRSETRLTASGRQCSARGSECLDSTKRQSLVER